jgi:hypothetical protein
MRTQINEEWEKQKRRELTDISAGLAMVGLIIAGTVDPEKVAKRAYAIADALSAERDARRGPEVEPK